MFFDYCWCETRVCGGFWVARRCRLCAHRSKFSRQRASRWRVEKRLQKKFSSGTLIEMTVNVRFSFSITRNRELEIESGSGAFSLASREGCDARRMQSTAVKASGMRISRRFKNIVRFYSVARIDWRSAGGVPSSGDAQTRARRHAKIG